MQKAKQNDRSKQVTPTADDNDAAELEEDELSNATFDERLGNAGDPIPLDQLRRELGL